MSAALRLVSSIAESDVIPTDKEALAERFGAVPGESKADKVKRQNRERQQKKRLRDAQAKLKAEAFHLPAITFYGGTVQAMIDVCKAGGFEESAEALTLLAHGGARLAGKDPQAFAALLAPVLAALALAGADLAKRDRHAFELLIAPPSRKGAEE
ncbi:hypothetical protein [Pseudomonas frederiksbergensis]|uniref:Uncharacterized protein n=1 Tax=Pseudomonas frederiksbergensis TaxID=104087 RepID=A0A423HSA9_9PSED|nr:hypothetical protein [Pseudomonas frederiksbergensis]RON16062.1 hypothetical protein BK662_11580 [Pseudomonas frederiksbergensis]